MQLWLGFFGERPGLKTVHEGRKAWPHRAADRMQPLARTSVDRSSESSAASTGACGDGSWRVPVHTRAGSPVWSCIMVLLLLNAHMLDESYECREVSHPPTR